MIDTHHSPRSLPRKNYCSSPISHTPSILHELWTSSPSNELRTSPPPLELWIPFCLSGKAGPGLPAFAIDNHVITSHEPASNMQGPSAWSRLFCIYLPVLVPSPRPPPPSPDDSVGPQLRVLTPLRSRISSASPPNVSVHSRGGSRGAERQSSTPPLLPLSQGTGTAFFLQRHGCAADARES